jgi:ferric-dicitrate binding protein FerR (iron transport regulator)
MLLVLTLTTWPTWSHSQTVCEAPNKCATGAQINAAADVLCRRARAKETEFDGLRRQLDENSAAWERCRGALQTTDAQRMALTQELEAAKHELSERWPWWSGVVVGAVLGAGAVFVLLL